MEQSPESLQGRISRFRESSAAIRTSFFDSEIRKVGDRVAIASHNLRRQFGISEDAEGEDESEMFSPRGNITLREWLTKQERVVNEYQCLHIFRQIIEIVNSSHSQGILLPNLRPSCIALSPFNNISLTQSPNTNYPDSHRQPMNAKSPPSSNVGFAFHESSEELQRSCTTSNFSEEYPKQIHRKQKSPMNEEISESKWYTSPEELASFLSTPASDMYRLGIILFELFCPFTSTEHKIQTMSSFCIRVLPPHILQKHPVEASFCLWLTNPDPNNRPKMRELLRSRFMKSPTDHEEDHETSTLLENTIEEQDQLLEFLLTLEKTKQEALKKTQTHILSICSEIGEVVQRHRHKKVNEENPFLINPRLKSNIKKIEAAYYTTRSKRLKNRIGHADPFLEGLCNYMAYSKLKVKADITQGDLMNSSNIVCCIAFDRDNEFFATAGINKKIKVFHCDNLMAEEGKEIHYPVGEMRTTSKLSCICWNSYIKSRIASSNFEGAVQVWDATRSQVVAEMRDHDKRVWSVDYSSTDPTMLASGSDDCSVKLWNTNQRGVVGTIRAKANACAVQFSKASSHFIVFGSADHKTYYYDLRNRKAPLSTFVGHSKTVSHVRFLDSCNAVSSSTDNTIKQWGLPAPPVLNRPVQTFSGHLNVKNFVGLSVANGYVASGSETNEVFVYNKAYPMAALTYNFHKNEVSDVARFVSSVCWRGQSTTLVAANSTGNIKILEMV